MSTFETLSQINVNEHTEQRQQFTYLSWSWAWSILMEHCPDATYEMLPDIIYPGGTMEVRTSITIGEKTHMMWLPVMDYKNKAIAEPNSVDINKARMRCLVKNIAMFGLGIYIYSGEDLPDLSYSQAKKILGEYEGSVWQALESQDASAIKQLVDEMTQGEVSAMKKVFTHPSCDRLEEIYELYKQGE